MPDEAPSECALITISCLSVPYNTVVRDESTPVLFALVEQQNKKKENTGEIIDDPMVPFKSVPHNSVVDIIIHNPLYSVVGKVCALANLCTVSPANAQSIRSRTRHIPSTCMDIASG